MTHSIPPLMKLKECNFFVEIWHGIAYINSELTFNSVARFSFFTSSLYSYNLHSSKMDAWAWKNLKAVFMPYSMPKGIYCFQIGYLSLKKEK